MKIVCEHPQLKVVNLENEEGSVELEICKNSDCAKVVRVICEHVKNEWVYTRNEVYSEEQKLICKLCGIDGT